MRKGSAWRLCLFAFLLAAGQSEDNFRQVKQDNSEDFKETEWRSGAPNNNDESNESIEEVNRISLPEKNYQGPAYDRKSYSGQLFNSYTDLINNYPYQGEDRNNVPNNNLISPNQVLYSPQEHEIVGIPPSIYTVGPKSEPVGNEPIVLWNPSIYGPMRNDQQKPVFLKNGAIVSDDLSGSFERDSNQNQEHAEYIQRPFQPVIVPDVDYNQQTIGLISKLVPTEDLINLHNIPGASNAINCSKTGEIYRLWQAQGCFVCVCLKEGLFKSAKPVCVSCSGCLAPQTARKPFVPMAPPLDTFPPVTLPPLPAPSPNIQASCKPLPMNEPFQSPLDPCKMCICTESLNVRGKIDANIRCERNPECVIAPDATTLSLISDEPLNVDVCDKMPANVIFPHPHDGCQLCKCSVVQVARGVIEQQVACYNNPECQSSTVTHPAEAMITLPPEPVVTSLPDILQPVTCNPIPSGVPFQNPLNPCQVCICTEALDPFGRPDVYIRCDDSRECVVPPYVPVPPTDIEPVPLPSCAKLPTNVPFPHPRDSCKTCKCTVQVTPAGPQEFISCYTNPECERKSKPHEPSICDRHPTNVLFPDPQDECKVCRCTLYKTAYGQTDKHISCYVKPECSSSTISPHTFRILPSPENKGAASCAPLPNGKPFENPLHPCQICVCLEILGPNGPDVQIECKENPHCVLPPEVTTVPSIENNTPVPLPACSKYPNNVLFPHPSDACRLCKCTEEVTSLGTPREYITCVANPECATTSELLTTPGPADILNCNPLPTGRPFQSPLNPCEICICTESVNVFGKPDVRIECQANPQCVIPPETVTTVPVIPDNKPVPLPLCTKYPNNVLFPHPSDACRVCKCTEEVTSLGTPREYITCFYNPECDTTPAPPAAWPPAPPGPLPGPSPHESCSPYAPNKPFQHPWDECQVCVCSQAISVGHVTIEVNCFTKKSCCIEIPFDLSELPSSSTGPYIIRPRTDLPGSISGQEGSVAIGADGQQVNLKEILDPNNIGNYLKPTGHHGANIAEQSHIHDVGSGSIYLQNNPDTGNRIEYNDPAAVYITNEEQNQDTNLYKQMNGAGYQHYKVPGYVYSGNMNTQYKIPIDIRNGANQYITSSNGKVVVPGYIDQRYITNVPIPGSVHTKPTYRITGDGQEYMPVASGDFQANIQPNIIGYPKPDWLNKWMVGSVQSSAANAKGSQRMRTKSGRPDSQSDEASGASE